MYIWELQRQTLTTRQKEVLLLLPRHKFTFHNLKLDRKSKDIIHSLFNKEYVDRAVCKDPNCITEYWLTQKGLDYVKSVE